MRDCTSVFPQFPESRLHAQEDIRGPLSELQQLVLPEIHDQIQDYRYRKEIKGIQEAGRDWLTRYREKSSK